MTVRNYERCVSFYRDALRVPLEEGKGYHHQECSWHEPYFHFALFPAPSEQPIIAFWVDNIDQAHKQAVAAGAKVVHEPRKEPWGRTAEYVDPEGNRVSLIEGPTRT